MTIGLEVLKMLDEIRRTDRARAPLALLALGFNAKAEALQFDSDTLTIANDLGPGRDGFLKIDLMIRGF